MNGSRRAARPTTRTSSCPPCVLVSAVIWKKQHLRNYEPELCSFGRVRIFWGDRRFGEQKNLPGAAGDGETRHAKRAGYRCGQGWLEPGPAQGPGQRQRGKTWRIGSGGLPKALRVVAVRGRRLQRSSDVSDPVSD